MWTIAIRTAIGTWEARKAATNRSEAESLERALNKIMDRRIAIAIPLPMIG